MSQGVTILGSTGSVGIHTLDVLSLHPDRYHVETLAANRNVDLMFQQCLRYSPNKVCMVDSSAARELSDRLHVSGIPTKVLSGKQCLSEIFAEESDIVVCSIVGAAGLLPTIAAVEAGKRILVANKEPLVMLGKHIIDLAEQTGACLLPLDSEHNAIFQCLPQQSMIRKNSITSVNIGKEVSKILLTGSGGPFRELPADRFAYVTPEQACAHPNWKMGRKISVDSATMMNKGLELIEACVLFGVGHRTIEIVVHPQSVIHSMVEYIDGSIIAQLGSPDMRVSIANVLAWPEKIVSGASSIDFLKLLRFDFEPPDYDRFSALRLAREAADKQGNLPAIMNAANEVAVEAFLQGNVAFDRIMQLIELAMEKVEFVDDIDLETVVNTDSETRIYCKELLSAERSVFQIGAVIS